MAGGLAKMLEEYPLRDGNAFELLVDGEVFVPRMLAAIDAAQELICLEMYLFESGRVATRFIEAMTRAAQRGVRTYVLLDAFGARGMLASDREQLGRAGVEMRFYNPPRWYPFSHWKKNIVRDHRKFLLVDNVCGFTGGAGITDAFVGHAGVPAWRESMLLIRGPVLADCQRLFERLWRWLGGEAFTPGRPPPPAVGALPARLVASHGFSGQAIYRSAKWAIRRSQRRLWLSTPYFIPSRRMRRALIRAARRGVDVRLLLPGPSDHPAVNLASQRHYSGLLRAGVQIYEYRSRVLHSKILLCDDWVSMGSSNYDRFTMRWNIEANLVIPSAEFAGRVREQFETDFSHSEIIALSDWQQRPWWLRLRQRFWAKIANLLDRLRRH
jgi:phosphatidylserine/phosphatidylglycerophosphate/cardiolipin synthase-like enzyme